MRERMPLLLFVAAVLSAGLGCTEEVPCAGNFTISTVEQLRAQQICTEIEGDLNITGSALTDGDLKENVRLHKVRGCLRINGNDALRSLSALRGLESVGGCVEIGHNDQLVDLEGLQNLNAIGGDLDISFNESLVNIQGLSEVSSVKGELRIAYNPSLLDVNGLSRLKELKGGIVLSKNESLGNIAGLTALEKIGGSLTISYNAELATCEAYSFFDLLVAKAHFSGEQDIKGNNDGKICE